MTQCNKTDDTTLVAGIAHAETYSLVKAAYQIRVPLQRSGVREDN